MKRMRVLMYVMCAILHSSSAQSEITRGFVSSQGSSTAVMTINAAGVEQLSSDFTGEIVISANNVTLDLRGFSVIGGTRGIRITGNNVTVQNGTVRGATIGVRVEGNNNQLMGLDLISNSTGVEITGNANMIENCNALNNTSAGFAVVGGSRNSFYNCSAIDNGSTGNAYGFVSQDGVANIFEECIAERTQTSGGSSFAGGFVLTGTEQKSKVLNCQANNASASTAAGIWAKTLTVAGCTPSLSLLPSGTFNATYQVYGVAWLNIGSSYYVASAGGPIAGPEFRVLQFNPINGVLSQLPSATVEYTQAGRSVAWLTIGNSYYLAATSENTLLVSVLQFNPQTGVLSTLPSATFGGVSSYAGSWITVGNSYYLAIGENNFARILQFNPFTGVLGPVPGAAYVTGGLVLDANWQQIGSSYYLAIAGNANPRLRILNFNPSTGSLTAVATFEPTPSEDLYNSSWLQTGTNYYIGTGLNTIRAVQFDPGANTLTQRASNNSSSWLGVQGDWLTIGSSYYLVCGSFNPSNNVNVFSFNISAGTLSNVAQYSYTIGSSPYVWQPAWQLIGFSKYIAFGGLNSVVSNPALVAILNFDDCQRYPQNNIFMHNQATGNVTGCQDDVAITTGLNTTNQWFGNISAHNTTNFNIGTQFPLSATKGTGDGVTENLDAALTTGGPAEKIMATVVDQTAQASTKISQLLQYNPVFVTSATTLSTSNYYLLTQPLLASAITILNGSNLTLDLNGHTVRNIAVTTSNRVTITNGFVRPSAYPTGTLTNPGIDGIVISGSTEVNVNNVLVTGAAEGVRMNSSSARLKLVNCMVNSNVNSGIWFESAGQSIVDLCQACRNRNFQGIPLNSGTEIKVYRCMSNRNNAQGILMFGGTPSTAELRSNFVSGNVGVGITYGGTASAASSVALNNFSTLNGGGTNFNASLQWGIGTASTSSANYTLNIQTTN